MLFPINKMAALTVAYSIMQYFIITCIIEWLIGLVMDLENQDEDQFTCASSASDSPLIEM